MGCTSSAPNTLSTNASKEDKSIQFEGDAEETYSKHIATIHTESEHRTEIKVLPPSDTTEPVQLVRNNKSTASLEPEKDLNLKGNIVESEHNDTIETTLDSKEEKDDTLAKLKLEEVVGKFIGITQQDSNHDKDPDPNSDEADESTDKDNDESDAQTNTESKENEDANNSKVAEDASPSQSQSSRATRWEALADIAAELPPSLAVDPITGQIYSLSK